MTAAEVTAVWSSTEQWARIRRLPVCECIGTVVRRVSAMWFGRDPALGSGKQQGFAVHSL
jgi:hypothetical protein